MNLLNPLTLMTISGLVVTGIGVSTLGSVKIHLARRLQIDEARVGGLVSLFGFTLIPIILAAGFLTDTVGYRALMLGGSLVMAVGMTLLAMARRYSTALLAILVLTSGWAALVDVLNVLIPHAFPGNTAFATNLGISFSGAGAFVTPLIAMILIRRAGFVPAVLLLAGLSLAPALLALGVEFPQPEPSPEQEGSLLTLLGILAMWLCALVFFFYSPLEACVGAWTTTYLDQQGVGETVAAGTLSGYWLAAMAAQLLTAFLLPAGSESQLLCLLALGSMLVLGGIVACRNRTVAPMLIVLAGLLFGPIMPTNMAVLLENVPEVFHGRAVGVLFAIGGIGWTTIPVLIGIRARKVGIRKGLLVAVAAAAALCLVTLASAWLLAA